MIYVPVLPYKLIDLLQTECPYFIGVHTSLFKKVKDTLSSDVLIVNLDKNEIQHIKKNWIEANISNTKDRIVELPKIERKKLLSRLNNPFIALSKMTDKTLSKSEIRKSFLRFFASVLIDYDNFLHIRKGEYKVNVEKLKLIDNNRKCFLKCFVSTNMFKYWLHEKGHPKSITESYDILLFQEYVIAEKNALSFLKLDKIV